MYRRFRDIRLELVDTEQRRGRWHQSRGTGSSSGICAMNVYAGDVERNAVMEALRTITECICLDGIVNIA